MIWVLLPWIMKRYLESDFVLMIYTDASSLRQTGNEKDLTMQAGKQRAVLPLIRKFNEHSTRLLDTALSVQHSFVVLNPSTHVI